MFIDTDEPVLDKIKKHREIYDKYVTEIAEKEIIRDSILDSLVRDVKNLIMPYSGKMLSEAFYQQNKTKKSERPMYEFLKNDLIDRLFQKEDRAKLNCIVSKGYEGYAYGFEFKVGGCVFELRIPNKEQVNTQTIFNTSFGQYELARKIGDGRWKLMMTSYSLDKVAKIIRAYLDTEREWNNV